MLIASWLLWWFCHQLWISRRITFLWGFAHTYICICKTQGLIMGLMTIINSYYIVTVCYCLLRRPQRGHPWKLVYIDRFESCVKCLLLYYAHSWEFFANFSVFWRQRIGLSPLNSFWYLFVVGMCPLMMMIN